jgi:DNA topoisomerase-3
VFCKLSCFALYTELVKSPQVSVVAVEDEQKVIPRPLPLNCARLVALASQHLDLDPRITLMTAFGLYEAGFISYPYSDCDCFPDGFDFKRVLIMLTGHAPIVQRAAVLRVSYEPPRAGQKAGASTPIYPCVVPTGFERETSEYRLFDFIARHFLAICSHDSVVARSVFRFQIGIERFTLAVPLRQDLHWLEVFPFPHSKIAKIAPSPRFTPGDVIGAKSLRMVSVSPKQHSVLTPGEIVEAAPSGRRAVDDLMGLATQGLLHRARDGFKPSRLGIAVAFAFARVGFDFEDPWLGRVLDDIADGVSEDHVGAVTALAAIASEMVARAGEVDEVFATIMGDQRPRA